MSGPTKTQIHFAQKFGKRYKVKPSDLLDVIQHESNFDPLATEHGGSVSNTPSESQGGGLTQFIPSTANQYGVQYGGSKHAQKTQIRGEAHYLHDLGYGGGSPSEVSHALAGYYGAASPYASDVISSQQYAKYDKKNVSIPGVGKGKTTTKGKTKTVQTAAAVDNSAARAQLALSFIQNPNKDFTDYLNYEQQKAALADVPAQTQTITKPGKQKNVQSANTVKSKGGPTLTGPSTHEIVEIGHWAENKFGLNVGENPHFGGVAPVHATNSYHYSGRAIDVSGDPATMRKFAHAVAKRYGSKLAELFWQGAGGINYDNGQPVAQGFVSDHTDHVHVAI